MDFEQAKKHWAVEIDQSTPGFRFALLGFPSDLVKCEDDWFRLHEECSRSSNLAQRIAAVKRRRRGYGILTDGFPVCWRRFQRSCGHFEGQTQVAPQGRAVKFMLPTREDHGGDSVGDNVRG